MSEPTISDPEQAQMAFYAAFERANLEQMMALWAQDEFVSCIHPNGPRLSGLDQVREGWRQILTHSPMMRFDVQEVSCTQNRDLVVYHVTEAIHLGDSPEPEFTVLATNVFRRTAAGWRMILHHASPTPESLRSTQGGESEDQEDQKAPEEEVTLH